MKTARAWYVATAAAVALVLLAGWFLVVAPKHSAAADLRAQTEAANAQGETLRAQLAQLHTQATGLAVEQRRLRTFEEKMPATVALPALIRSLNGAATATQADLTSLTPGVPVLPTATTPAAPAAVTPSAAGTTPTPTPSASSSPPAVAGVPPVGVAATGGAAPYSVVPLTFTVTGTYFVLQRFFTAVEALPRSLVLTSVALTPAAAEAGSVTAAPVLTAALSGSAYVSALPPVPAISAPAVAPTPVPVAPQSGNALAPQATGAAGTRK